MFAALAAALITAACTSNPTAEPVQTPTEATQEPAGDPSADTGHQAALDEAMDSWDAFATTNYAFDFNWVCFCLIEWVSKVTLTASGGAIISADFVESGEPVTDEQQLNFYKTVDGLFDVIQDAIDRSAVSIQVEYDPDLGYPVSAFIDYETQLADEELGFEVSNVLKVER